MITAAEVRNISQLMVWVFQQFDDLFSESEEVIMKVIKIVRHKKFKEPVVTEWGTQSDCYDTSYPKNVIMR